MRFPSRAGAAGGLAVAGLAFAVYPVLRPYGPESGLEFAADLASTAWLAAHVLGMVGFTALALALRSLVGTGTPWRWGGRSLRGAETRMWLGLALLLPYYGAEAYGLSAVGRHALDRGADVLAVAGAFRYAPFEVTTFTAGLLLLMLVGGRLAHGTWAAGGAARVGGLLAGVGLATYLPQFFTTPQVRMAHGIILGLGLVVLARSVLRPLDQELAAADNSGSESAHREPIDAISPSGRTSRLMDTIIVRHGRPHVAKQIRRRLD